MSSVAFRGGTIKISDRCRIDVERRHLSQRTTDRARDEEYGGESFSESRAAYKWIFLGNQGRSTTQIKCLGPAWRAQPISDSHFIFLCGISICHIYDFKKSISIAALIKGILSVLADCRKEKVLEIKMH